MKKFILTLVAIFAFTSQATASNQTINGWMVSSGTSLVIADYNGARMSLVMSCINNTSSVLWTPSAEFQAGTGDTLLAEYQTDKGFHKKAEWEIYREFAMPDAVDLRGKKAIELMRAMVASNKVSFHTRSKYFDGIERISTKGIKPVVQKIASMCGWKI